MQLSKSGLATFLLLRDFDCNIVAFLVKAPVFVTHDYYGEYRSPPPMNDILGDGGGVCVRVGVRVCVLACAISVRDSGDIVQPRVRNRSAVH